LGVCNFRVTYELGKTTNVGHKQQCRLNSGVGFGSHK
jgi:hypothetical protein